MVKQQQSWMSHEGQYQWVWKPASYIASTASSIAQKVFNALLFGSFGDLTTSSRYITPEKALRYNPNTESVVGDSLGGSVVLELQKRHPELMSRTYGSPVFDLKRIYTTDMDFQCRKIPQLWWSNLNGWLLNSHNILPTVLSPKSINTPISEQRQETYTRLII